MVSCRDRQDGGAVLKVADNGPGIAPQERQRVFDRFHRVAGSGERGSGIGLALVAQIARRHGAEITLGAGLEDRGIALTVVPVGRALTSRRPRIRAAHRWFLRIRLVDDDPREAQRRPLRWTASPARRRRRLHHRRAIVHRLRLTARVAWPGATGLNTQDCDGKRWRSG